MQNQIKIYQAQPLNCTQTQINIKQKKKWGFVHNSSPSANRRRMSLSTKPQIQQKQQPQLIANESIEYYPSDYPKNKGFGIKDKEQQINHKRQKSQTKGNDIYLPDKNQRNQVLIEQKVKKQSKRKSSQSKQYLEGSLLESGNNADSSDGSFLTQIMHCKSNKKSFTKLNKLLSEQNKIKLQEMNKSDSQLLLGLQSEKNDLSIQSKSSQKQLKIQLQSKISVQEPINFKKKNINNSVYQPALKIKIDVEIRTNIRLLKCKKCEYELEIQDAIDKYCKICYLLEYQQKKISFQSNRNCRNNSESSKRDRAKTLLKKIRDSQKYKIPLQTYQNRQEKFANYLKNVYSGNHLPDQKKFNSLNKDKKLRIQTSPSIPKVIDEYRPKRGTNLNETKQKCANKDCNKHSGTLIKHESKSYCIRCYYQFRIKNSNQ